MNRRLRIIWRALGAGLSTFIVSLGACDDSSGPDADPGLHVLSGGGRDTVMAMMPELVVLVRDSIAQARPGITVRFTSISSVPNWYVLPLAEQGDQWQQLDTTDADGRARVRIRLGTVTGTGAMVVEARSLGYADTAYYETLPGAPARVAAVPKDSAAYTGGGYQMTGRVFDRFDNVRQEAAAITATSAGVTREGSTIRATAAIGREYAVVAYQSLRDTGWMSIVPRGTILTRNRRYPRNGTFVITNLDGSGFREFLAAQAPEYFGAWGDMGPAWTADGNAFVFHDGDRGKRLFISDLNGVARPFLTSSVAGHYELWPTLTRDGQWAFFSRGSSSELAVPWRAHADGSGAAALARDHAGGAWHVSPSPDGSQLAYETPGCGGLAIRVLDIASGISRAIACGRSPRWSPNSDLIAYVSGGVRLVHADGTGDRVLAPASNFYELRLDWSPDGEWIVAFANHGSILHLVRVESGLVLPLAFTQHLEQPAWRPRSP